MEQMTQAERERANTPVSPDSSIRERAEKAAEESYPKDLHFREECSDYKCGAIKSWKEGYLEGYEQAMKDAEKLKD